MQLVVVMAVMAAVRIATITSTALRLMTCHALSLILSKRFVIIRQLVFVLKTT